jgi:uncharacterized membrane protein
MEGPSEILKWVLIAACVGSGMMAGLFCAFSSFMMKALSSLSDSNGIEAMQAINRFIVGPGFLLVFLGTGVLCAISALLVWNVSGPTLLTITAAGIYIVGCVFSTIAFNVPLNNQLEAVDSASEEGRLMWRRYLARWTRWNHVRSVATLISTVLLALTIANPYA